MGLPRYVINYSDIFPHILSALGEAELKALASGVNLNVSDAALDTQAIVQGITAAIDLNVLINGNVDEISAMLDETAGNITEMNAKHAEALKALRERIVAKLELATGIREAVEQIAEQLVPLGDQMVKGLYDFVPPGRGDYPVEVNLEGEAYLTAVTYSQIGWKLEDAYSLFIGEDAFIENVSTKEIAEKKRFNRYPIVPAGTPVRFVLHNRSGNSRQMWLDVEYVMKEV
jgi:hypothetical protein